MVTTSPFIYEVETAERCLLSQCISSTCRCSRDGESDYEVAFYWNEKPLLDLCKKGVCSWQEFEDNFKPFLNVTTDFCEFKWMNVDK